VIDGRDPDAFDAGHIAGSVNLPAGGKGLGTRAGWAVAPGERLVVVAGEVATARALTAALHAVGLWSIDGVAAADPAGWDTAGLPVVCTRAWDAATLAGALTGGEARLLDVRDEGEWASGHVAGAYHLPLHQLADGRSARLPEGQGTLAVACAAGLRAAIAASLLRRRDGERDIVRLSGGGVRDLCAHGVALVSGR
jgi:hydroxyacylglutathione hydrolase